jgi:hypothetical protein
MLEQQQHQLVNGLQELYKLASSGQGWEGPPLADSESGRPLTHDILSRLGVLHPESQSASFDDLESMRRRLMPDEADSGSRKESEESEGGTSPSHSSLFEATHMQRIPSTPYTDQLPTPPMQSPLPQSGPPKLAQQTAPSGCYHVQWDGSSMDLQAQAWASSPVACEPNFPSEGFPGFNNTSSHMTILGDLSSSTASMPEWSEDDFNSFLNSTLV